MTIVLQTPDRLPQIMEEAVVTHRISRNVLIKTYKYKIEIPDLGPVVMPDVRVIHCAGVK